MWVRITRERRFLVPDDHRIGIHYMAGMVIPIKRAWGTILIADGDAVEVRAPPRSVAD